MGRFRNIMSKETILFRGGMEIIKQATNSYGKTDDKML